MALFKIFKGNKANLPAEHHTGYCYLTQDEKKFYIDLDDVNRVPLNAEVASKLFNESGNEAVLKNSLFDSETEIPTSSAVIEVTSNLQNQLDSLGAINGILKGDGNGNITTAVAGEDYLVEVCETNNGLPQRFWRGTKAEYDAVVEKNNNTMYIVTDEEGNVSGGSFLPTEGEVGQVLTKTEDGATWQNVFPSTGETGSVLTKTASGVEWSIIQQSGTLSLSTTVVELDANNLTKTITLNGNFDGTISLNPSSVSGLTFSINGNTITITGDGSTSISSVTVTVSVSAGTNYTAPSNATFTVSATYWEWGSETAIGDATWWAGLKTWAATATTSERAACVGKTKMTSLSTAVLGANNILMRCIGADQDGTGTLTFQSAGVLPNTLSSGYNSSNTNWTSSYARTYCQNIYNYCSAKSSIKTVSKGTAAYNSSRNGAVTYTDETVWIASEREMGLDSYSSLSVANSSTSKAECTQGYNAYYSYYTSNSNRIKYQASADGTLTSTACWYWERSRLYNGSSRVCTVYTDGSAYDYAYSNTTGRLAPAFVIG